MSKTILYMIENNEIPQNVFVLTEQCLSDIENIKKQNIYAWQGNMDTLVSAISKLGMEKGIALFDVLLRGVVAEWQNHQWYHYTCNAVVMHCCAGAYIRIVNQKEIKNESI